MRQTRGPNPALFTISKHCNLNLQASSYVRSVCVHLSVSLSSKCKIHLWYERRGIIHAEAGSLSSATKTWSWFGIRKSHEKRKLKGPSFVAFSRTIFSQYKNSCCRSRTKGMNDCVQPHFLSTTSNCLAISKNIYAKSTGMCCL